MYQALSLQNGILEYASKCLKPSKNCGSGFQERKAYVKEGLTTADPVYQASRGTHVIRLHDKYFYTNYNIIYNCKFFNWKQQI